MNPIKQIGRYEIQILSIIAIVALDNGTYKVILPYNVELIFTAEEKERLDQARDEHELTMQVYGMARGLGRVGM